MIDIVTSQYLEEAHCNLNEPFVIVLKTFFFLLNRISAFRLDLRDLWNHADLFYAQTVLLHTSWKKYNRTALRTRI